TLSQVRNSWKGTVAPVDRGCILKSGVKEEVADNFYKFGDMPDDLSFKCYLHCNALNLRIVDSTGQILPKHIVEIFDYTDLPLAEKCSKILEADPCQRAYLMVKCFHDNLSERYSV
ncbi:hypothetical protein ILUMI_02576, partial [Ignelater luminosus]